jgi:hypothetical protein
MASVQATFEMTILLEQKAEPSDKQNRQQRPNDAKEPDIDLFIGNPQKSGSFK